MLELLALPFFQRALIIGLLLSIIMALIGVLVVLRRLTFFADAIGHSALTGIALGLVLAINPFMAALLFALAVAGSIGYARRFSRIPLDTILAVAFPAAVALGVIIVQRFPGYQTNLIAFLFGDILTVSTFDVALAGGLVVATVALLLIAGKSLIMIALDESLAKSEGIAVFRHELLLLLLLAAVIALAVKLVGIVLVTALLVIPAASAQNVAWSMTSMFVGSVLVSVVSTGAGMLLSAWVDTPTGPTIVLVAAAIFAVSFLISKQRTSAV